MTGSTAALLGLGVAGAAGGYYWFVLRPRQLAAAAAALPAPPTHPTPSSKSTTWSTAVISAEGAIQAKTGIPVAAIGAAAQKAPLALKVAALPVAATAAAQSLVTHPLDTAKAAISIVAHPVDSVKSVANSVVSIFGGGSSKVCRASNNKDVFPNDMQQCAALGIYDCNACGQLYNLTTRKWPWQ